MNRWRHSLCLGCWTEQHPRQQPVRLAEEFRVPAVCCFCGKNHESGIYIRADAASTPCRGDGPEHNPKERK